MRRARGSWSWWRRQDVRYPRGYRPQRRSPYGARLGAVLLVALLIFGALLGRLVQLQVVDGDDMQQQAQRINSRDVSAPAPRGRILAADGTPLVTNGSISVLTLDPTVLADSDDGGVALLNRVSSLVGGDPQEMKRRTMPCGSKGAPPSPVCFAGSAVEPIPILRGVDMRKALTLLERPEDFPGIGVQQVPVREFPAPRGVNAAQTIGYLGSTGAEDLERNSALTANDVIGRSGLEYQYDDVLRGEPGITRLAVDARGLPVRTVSSSEPTPGRDLLTSIDLRVQAAAEKALDKQVSALRAKKSPVTGAAAVVLDASDGSVVAMASNPTYDPAVWNGGIRPADYARLTDPKAKQPMLNRVVGQLQPPASTFKAISLPGALASGIDPKGSYQCSSSVTIGGRTFTNFESVAFGTIDLPKVLEVSCDTVFYRWAHAEWRSEGGSSAPTSTANPFVDAARTFGLGRRTGVDLPGESAGRIPDRAWKKEYWEQTRTQTCRRAKSGYPDVKDKTQRAYFTQLAKENCAHGYQWLPGDAVNFSIGQGDVLTTPLQIANAYAAIANGGTLWAPRVVSATRAADGSGVRKIAPKKEGELALSADARRILTQGLRDVVTGPQGTGRAAFAGFPDDYPISGKTGTAEVYGKDATAWFASYGPKLRDGRQYVVAVMIEQGGTGATAAAPVARSIWDTLYTVRGD